MQTDVNLEMECERLGRIVDGLNDELSRQLLGEYAADLREAQQKQWLLDRNAYVIRSIDYFPI